MAQGLGTFGAVATASTSGIVGVATGVAAANIGFLDTDPADGTPGVNEALVLSIDGSATVKVGDILLDPGTGLAGTSGSTIQTTPGGVLDFTIGATNVVDLMRFVDTLPTYANGGPDGVFNPGEPLFLDLDQTGTPSTADRLLASGTGVTGTVGGAVTGTQSESTWDDGVECVYQGTPTTVTVGMKRLSACAAYAAGSNVKAADTDLGTNLIAMSGLVGSFPATRTLTGGATTNTDATVTTAAAAFLATDVGAAISGTGIPAGAWITAFTSTTSVEISSPATATGTGLTFTVTPTGTRTVLDGITTLNDATVGSATPAFTEDDVGRTITGTGIPAGATIIQFTSTTSVEISAVATATGAGISLALGSNSGLLLTGYAAWVGTGTVASGHYRVSGTPGTPATVVNCGAFGADAECGTVTATLSNGKVSMASRPHVFTAGDIAFFDANANGGATPNADDRLVLDVDSNGYVSPPDVRLNTAGSQTFGSRPTLSATGETHGILGLTPAPIFIYLDTTTNVGQVDSTEALAVSVNGDTVMDIGDICLTTIGSCSPGAQRVGTTTNPTTSGTWKNVALASNVGVLGYLDANNNDKYDTTDSLYLHFGTALPAAAASGDLLLASATGGSGTRITTSPGTLKAFAPAGYKALDMDGSGAFSVGDVLYIERAGGVAGVAEPGDVRLNSGTGLTGFGRNVQEGDADAVSVLIATAATAATLFAYRDLDSSPGLSLGDPVFLLPRATACPPVGSDVILASGVSTTLTPGNFVGGGATTCVNIGAGPAFGYTPVGAFSTTSTFYVDMDGDGTVEIGDIRLAGNSAGAAGTRVAGTLTSDQNTPLTVLVLAAGGIKFADTSGDLVQAALDTIILDRDANGLFTPGDLVLSTGATTSSGGGGGGGGGGSTATSTATTTASGTTTTSSTDTTTSTSTNTTTSTSTSTGATLASINQALADSLMVTRADGVNTLMWDLQPGVAGYQIFASESPFVLLGEVPGDETTFTDSSGGKGTFYVVTAFFDDLTKLTADMVNNGEVPGYSGVPTGEKAPAGKKGFIPAPGLALALLALGAAFVLVRRKL